MVSYDDGRFGIVDALIVGGALVLFGGGIYIVLKAFGSFDEEEGVATDPLKTSAFEEVGEGEDGVRMIQ